MKKALVVDDSAYNRTFLTAILRKQGLTVETSDNGEDAVSHFQSFQPDVVFLDYIMPKKTGVEALAEMKRHNPNFIGIMLTSISSADDVANAKAAGASAYILKPYETEKIVGILKKFNVIEEA